jgi:Leucine-rich repeat (LRR) protein
MASWLSAGSVEDGTVVRRTSAAQPTLNLNINATDLFSPSKLESIFTTKDESVHSDKENESFSFIPPSPTKADDSPQKTLDDTSELPSDLSQGTSIAVKPSKRQSLGTDDYLSEASRVMTILRQANERKRSTIRRHPSTDLEPSVLYEGPPHRWITPTDPGDVSLHLDPMPTYDDESHEKETQSPTASLREDSRHERPASRASEKSMSLGSLTGSIRKRKDRNGAVQRSPSKRVDWLDAALPDDPSSLADTTPAPEALTAETKGPTVIRSPSKKVDWVAATLPEESSSHAESLPERESTVIGAKGPTVIRSPSKRVDWVEQALTGPPSPTCETQLEDTDVFSRGVTQSPPQQVQYELYQDSESDLAPLPKIKSCRIPQYGQRELSEAPPTRIASESQLMRLPPRPAAPTPPISREYSLVARTPRAKEFSILSLTPLPDFTMHQDDPEHPERSFVDERAHAKALKQAHGVLALVRDSLIKAITDGEPSELYWDQIGVLDISMKGLISVHSLDEFCPNLVRLDVSGNAITHLNGIPSSLRGLQISKNALSSIVAWEGLRNLQFLDISGNRNIENLDGFSRLHHLHHLVAKNCSITNMDGIQHLDCLMDIDLSGNKLTAVDFRDTGLLLLKHLDLSSNCLEQLSHIDRLKHLLMLDVSNNKLSEITPANRRGPKLLDDFAAENNQLTTFNFKRFPALRFALLDGNKISRVHGLSKARKLERLSLRSQEGQTDLVNHILCTPNDCRSITLSNNPVPGGHLMLPELPHHSLFELELAGCSIAILEKGFSQAYPNLRNLNLNHNAINDISYLQGMPKLQRLVLVGNRIRRMRRTCLVVGRLPSITILDIRDNPLTLGFHPPSSPGVAIEITESKWRRSLDENTKMRRRLTELLLAENCKQLQSLDALEFDRSKVLRKEEIWKKCEERGAVVER